MSRSGDALGWAGKRRPTPIFAPAFGADPLLSHLARDSIALILE